jgi:hypothetical protein
MQPRSAAHHIALGAAVVWVGEVLVEPFRPVAADPDYAQAAVDPMQYPFHGALASANKLSRKRRTKNSGYPIQDIIRKTGLVGEWCILAILYTAILKSSLLKLPKLLSAI